MTFPISSLRSDPLIGLSRRQRIAQIAHLAHPKHLARGASLAGMLAGALALTGCYVVPIHPPYSQQGSQHGSTVYAPPAPPMPAAPMTFSARLYPSNDLASGYGMVMALVTNDLNGRGTFSTNINGENFTGEATRAAGSARSSYR